MCTSIIFRNCWRQEKRIMQHKRSKPLGYCFRMCPIICSNLLTRYKVYFVSWLLRTTSLKSRWNYEIARIRILLILHARIKNKIMNKTKCCNKFVTSIAVSICKPSAFIPPCSPTFCYSSKLYFRPLAFGSEKIFASLIWRTHLTCLNEQNGVTRTKIRRYRGSALFTWQRNILMRELAARPTKCAAFVSRVQHNKRHRKFIWGKRQKVRTINRYSVESSAVHFSINKQWKINYTMKYQPVPLCDILQATQHAH